MSFLEPIPSVMEMTNYTLDELMKNYAIKGKEICPYRHNVRFDVIGINRNKKEVRIFEVKSSRADFTSDKKWQSYLPFCTHFAFVAPKGVIKIEELPKGIGLVEFWYEEGTNCKDETYHYLTYQYTRRCSRLQKHPAEEYYVSLLEGFVMRLITEAEEFKYYWEMQKQIKEIKYDILAILKHFKVKTF